MTLSHDNPFAFSPSRLGQDAEFRHGPQGASTERATVQDEQGRGCHPQDEPHDLAVAFLPTQRTWHTRIPAALAGGAAIATSVGFLCLEGIQPQFEGRVQIFPQGTEAVLPVASSSAQLGTSSVAPPEAVTEMPVFSQSDHVQFLTNTILPRAVEQLRAQGFDLSLDDLSERIQVAWDDTTGLEIAYRADDAEGVHQVIGAIAHAYETHTGICQSQICRSAQYIQAQIPQVQQDVARLTAELHTFRQQNQIVDLNRQHRELEAEVHEFRRIQQVAAQELAIAQAELVQQQQALGLSAESQTAQELLKRSPAYSHLLSQWATVDQQMVNHALQGADPAEQPDVIQHQHHLTQQIYGEGRSIADALPLYDMPSELRYAIIDRPQRLGTIYDWLKQAQQVQLLSLRLNSLEAAATQLDTHVQRWRSLLAQHRRLESQITVAQQTLTDYQERYVRLQQQSRPQQMAWQPVAPPDVLPLKTPLTQVAQWFTQRFADAAHAHEVSHP